MRLGAKANFEAKKSRLMRSVNKYVLGQFGLLFVMCTFACIYYGIWAGKNQDDLWWLLDVPQEEALGVSIFKKWFTLFLVCAQLVPISLQVSTEFIKTFQAVMMNLDILMYGPGTTENNWIVAIMLVKIGDQEDMMMMFDDGGG